MNAKKTAAALKSVPSPGELDAKALAKITKAHKLKLEAEAALETAETTWANAKKAMLDATTETKKNRDECIQAAGNAKGKDANKHLKSIVDAQKEHDETVEEHTDIVAGAADVKKKAAKLLAQRDAEERDAIENSAQETFDFGE